MAEKLPNVVIVGAGTAGTRAAYLLTQKLDTSKFNLIVINPRPYYIIYTASARAVVSDRDNLKEKIFVPIEDILKSKGRFIEGKVSKVEPENSGGHVVLSNGETVPYRILILSTGVSWASPFQFPEGSDGLDDYLSASRKAFKDASSIVLVGGGAVGSEFAGELRDIYPDKKITIVHGSNLPLNDTYSAKFRRAVRKRLETRNIDLVLDDYIVTIPSPSEHITKITTRKGKEIKTDLVISTRGQSPNTSLFVDSFGKSILSSRGLVKVEPTLQLVGHKDIFVIGDVIDWDEQKQAAKATVHADLIVPNIISVIRDKTAQNKYKGSTEGIFLSNGKRGGVGYLGTLGGITFGDWVTRVVKAEDLFVPMLRGYVGLK